METANWGVITGGTITGNWHNANEYISTGFNDKHDVPIYTVEQDNKKTLLYELIGVSKENLTAEVEFINKTKQTFLNIKGEFKDELTGWENDCNIHLFIDTKTYDGYSWNIVNGILTIELYEIMNEVPEFNEI